MSAMLPLLGIWLLVVLSPGPDFLVTVHYATARSRRHGLLVGLGVTAGILVWIAGSMLGLAVLLARLSWLYHLVRLVGAAYLAYLGIRMLWSTWARRRSTAPEGDAVPREVPAGPPSSGATSPASATSSASATSPAGAPVPGRNGLVRAWRVGFLTNIANPKAVAFFGSLFGALLPRHVDVALRVELGAVMLAMVATWYTCVALLFGLPLVVRVYRRARRWIDRTVAVVLISLAGRLAIER